MKTTELMTISNDRKKDIKAIVTTFSAADLIYIERLKKNMLDEVECIMCKMR